MTFTSQSGKLDYLKAIKVLYQSIRKFTEELLVVKLERMKHELRNFLNAVSTKTKTTEAFTSKTTNAHFNLTPK